VGRFNREEAAALLGFRFFLSVFSASSCAFISECETRRTRPRASVNFAYSLETFEDDLMGCSES